MTGLPGNWAKRDIEMREHLNRWQAESLRLTTFHQVGSINSPSPDWWQRVLSGQPQQQISRPGEALVQQSGAYAGQQLLINARPDRVDWIFHSVPNASTGPIGATPTLGPMRQALAALQTLSEKWSRQSEPTTRLAVAAVLFQDVADLSDAYGKLSKYLPSVDLSGVVTPDFLYQINRPSMSTSIEGLIINRLNKWSVAQSGSIAIAIGSGGTPGFNVSSLGIACRLELDINTAAENTEPFAPTAVPELLSELIDHALDVAELGDTQ